jgi:alpha-1,2-mannosyltransferase
MINMKNSSIERSAIALLLAAFLGICATVFATALLGGPSPVALTGFVLALCTTPMIARRLPREFDGMRTTRPVVSALWLLLSLAALVRFAGLALFMADPTHPEASTMWFDGFYVNHSCFSGYWKAADVLASGGKNIYDSAHYAESVGRFKLDEFLYPPQFLLLPSAAAAMGAGFQAMRAAWFAVDALLIAGAMLALNGWIGGQAGRRAALLLPAVFLALPTLITLQTGNFQLAALMLAVWAMLHFDRGNNAAGGAMLGVAMVKIFPGILCAYLLFTRRWKPLAWSVGFSLLYLGVAVLAFGTAPFQDFVGYELPRIASGEVWAFLELPGLEGVIAMNDSVPGLVLKLRVLGVDGMGLQQMATAAWIWSFALVVFTLIAARRAKDLPRIGQACVWIALLGLTALRSPFVPDDYGLFPALWLWTLVAATMATSAARIAVLAAAWCAFALVMPWAMAAPEQITLMLAVSTASQLLAIAIMFWAMLRRSSPKAQANVTPLSRVAGARQTVAI